ncbi:HEAT repeat domain-containing protein [Methanofervidicoccus abyssi]|uniref:Condensin complex subunit 1 C-terminal domain-containing protein n=1 Tax=Methanofervidicoccus abyssi TaxID=2082189 RepID=A0A401HRD3_9EURY|nr:HEAT repeat domain-containing protein [Methanofervidicoccus abyssi]GBF36809.1 hypothetical protein MHHB_P1039 [Methanofervidicoccus abyssi]
MYDQMSQKDLLQLFLEYYKQDWKKRSEAARILGYINDQELIEKLTPYIVELALDTNRFIRVNLAHSLKKIVLEYNIINEDIFVLLYIWANSPIAVLSEMARRIVSSLDIHVISKYVISLSLKLYSSEPIKVLYALFSIGFISTVNPEYIINTLPEIITTACGHRYKLIQLLALEILEELVDIKKEHLVSNFAPVYRVYIWTVYKKEGLQFKKGSVEYILSKYFKKHLTKDDVTDLIYDLIQLQTPRKKIILLLMYTHFKPLRELLNEDENLGKVLLEEVLNNIESDNFIVKLSAILLFSKIITVEKVYKNLSKNDIDNFFKVIEDSLVKGNYLLKGFSLEALCNLVKWSNSQYILKKVEEVIDKVDMEKVMSEGYLCYYNGVCILLKLNRECPSTKSSPYFDRSVIEEVSSLGMDDFRHLILNITTSVKRSVWICGWLDRFYSGKYLGNLLHVKPEYCTKVLNDVKYLTHDNYFMVRNLGIWILRTIVQLGISLPEDLIIDTLVLFDDRFSQCRLEYMLFWKTVLEKSPNLLDNEIICGEIAYELIAKYLNDGHIILREAYLDILEKSGIIEKYPVLKYFKDYYTISEEEKKEVFKRYWKFKELRKAIAVAIKLKLKEFIKNKKYNAIREYLDMISQMEIHREIFYMLYELILLKHMGFKEAGNIINNIRDKHPTIPYYLEKRLFFNINEPIIIIRSYKLKRLLAMVKEGFYISYDLVNKVKEVAIYEHVCGENTEIALKILSEINDEECKSIVKEKLELMKYIKEKPIVKNKKLKEMDWREVCLMIEYLPTEGKLIISGDYDLEDLLNKMMDILEKEDKIIVKIKILDYLINEIYENEELLNMLLSNRNLFKIIYNLCSDNKHLLLFKRAVILLEELASVEEGWLERNIIEYYKEGVEYKKPLRYLLYMLSENIPLYFKLEILRAVKKTIKYRVEQCKKLCVDIRKMLEEGKITKEEILSKYKDIMGIHAITSPNSIICQNMDNALIIVCTIFSGDIKKQPWILIKNALDILLLMCDYVLSDENIVSTVIKKLLEYYEVLKDEEIIYLYLYIRKLLERSNYNIEKLGEEYLRRYEELKRRVLV